MMEERQTPLPYEGEVGEPSRSKGEPGEGAACRHLGPEGADPQHAILKQRAREHRKNPTLAERRLWSKLRGQRNGITFRRQQVVGAFIVDFFCSSAKLVVELDGWSHDDTYTYDVARQEWLQDRGYKVIRLGNLEVIKDADGCASSLFLLAEQLIEDSPFPRFQRVGCQEPPHPNPLPQRGEGTGPRSSETCE
jgi:very-short-patch-repair endonuclease